MSDVTPTGISDADWIGHDDGPVDKCWCGVATPYYAPLPSRCGGSGTIDCHCGGDQCVCHWHGEVECFGCSDCQESDDDESEESEQ